MRDQATFEILRHDSVTDNTFKITYSELSVPEECQVGAKNENQTTHVQLVVSARRRRRLHTYLDWKLSRQWRLLFGLFSDHLNYIPTMLTLLFFLVYATRLDLFGFANTYSSTDCGTTVLWCRNEIVMIH